MLAHMFHLPIPLLEKLIRPVIVYLVLIALLRIFGKRELAQLNPFDLVVLLSLSNTVQNALIGDDNSVTGGIIGATALLSINFLVVRLLYKHRRMNAWLGGTERVLIQRGRPDPRALAKELLTEEELLGVVRRQGFDNFHEVHTCILEPNGSFYIEGRKPSQDEVEQAELFRRLDTLTAEVKQLRSQLSRRPG